MEIGSEIDLLSIHHHRSKDGDLPGYATLMASPLSYERLYGNIRDMVREIVPSSDIGVALNEWNTTFRCPRQHTMESARHRLRLMTARSFIRRLRDTCGYAARRNSSSRRTVSSGRSCCTQWPAPSSR